MFCFFGRLENEYFLLNYVFHVLRVVNGIMDDLAKQGGYRQSFTGCGGFHLWIFGVNKVADTLILVIPVSGLVLIFGCLLLCIFFVRLVVSSQLLSFEV